MTHLQVEQSKTTPVAKSPRGQQEARRWKPSTNSVYGGVVGTVFASATLAAIPIGQSAGYSAAWVAASVGIAAVTRSYGQHVSAHQVSAATGFWKDLRSFMLTGIPMVVASVPTLLLLWAAHVVGWRDDAVRADGSLAIGYTSCALLMNALLLFGWGVTAGRISGYSRLGARVVGLGNTALGVAVIILNLAIK
ncbi:hypothetical protein [Mycolicibacterium obuense]|uniref:Uncharacterized protein n=1 Tax=Mycolicibacterium obuense TaxID=1807 RepID=A0A0J6VTM2_9MYCO|nr:hypothetical protein [Mycolicibacterium obuense]KMO73514.1 hypothetical protein MOBUDSM44075_03846 [Mycolicibacterium obuense]